MAGSYHHVIDDETGMLLDGEGINGMLECSSGDVVECVTEMYGMIWYLAARLSSVIAEQTGDLMPPGLLVEEACERYETGLDYSPGVMEED